MTRRTKHALMTFVAWALPVSVFGQIGTEKLEKHLAGAKLEGFAGELRQPERPAAAVPAQAVKTSNRASQPIDLIVLVSEIYDTSEEARGAMDRALETLSGDYHVLERRIKEEITVSGRPYFFFVLKFVPNLR